VPRLVGRPGALLHFAKPRPVGFRALRQSLDGQPDQLRAREPVELACVVVRVDDDVVRRVDDENRVARVFEKRAVLALAAAQLVVSGFALQDAPQLGANEHDDVEQPRVGTRVMIGEELEHREDALPDEHRKREYGARRRPTLAVVSSRR
jgi:hypothetical protein